MLQTRSGKRTGPAAVENYYDLAREGVMDKNTALTEKYAAAADITQLLLPRFVQEEKERAARTAASWRPGLNASPAPLRARPSSPPIKPPRWAMPAMRWFW